MSRRRCIPVLLAGALGGCGEDEPSTQHQAPVPECAPGEIALADGSCLRPGIAECPVGFTREGDHGCAPILPPDDCPPGQLAVPGDDTCRPVGDCGDGAWGDIPIDATTVFVNAAYAGASPDGTQAHPYPTIGEAIDVVAPGGIVAVAAGSYAERVTIEDQTVRLWGRCPAMVEIVAPTTVDFGVRVVANAHGTEVRGLAVTQHGMGVSGSTGVQIDGVWIHDTLGIGFMVATVVGPASAVITDSLVEGSTGAGIRLEGGELEVRRTMVRDTTSSATEPRATGVWVQPLCSGQACDPAQRGTLLLADSHITRAQEAGVFVLGSEALIERSVVTHTQPRPVDGKFGEGVVAEPVCQASLCDLSQRASVTVRQSYVAANHTFGVFVMASDVAVDSSVLRDTRQRDDNFGRGAHVQYLCTENGCDPAARGSLVIHGTVVDQCRESGVWNIGSDLELTTSVIRQTQPAEVSGLFGDGIGVMQPSGATTATTIARTLVTHNHRAGIASFGAELLLTETTIWCSPVAMSADSFEGNPAAIVNSGGNHCGCDDEVGSCKALSASLAPPPPLADP